MTVRCHYFPGGWSADAPNGNLAECWDLAAGTYTRYDTDGTVAETRPLSADETMDLSVVQAGQVASNNVGKLGALTQQAITDNDAYLALTSPTAAQQQAQIRRLTRQGQAVARYLSTVVPQPGQPNNLADVTDVTTP